jgi:sporulation protein YlmC with PRC-barrel domain
MIGDASSFGINPIITALRALGLAWCRAWLTEKHLPQWTQGDRRSIHFRRENFHRQTSIAKPCQRFCILEAPGTFGNHRTEFPGATFSGGLMARYGTLGDYRFNDTQEAAIDIRGSKVYGLKDQELGKIDDVVFDEATGAIVFVVVDTGGWLSSNKVIVPPQEIRPSLQHENDFLVDLTKEQIESFPPYDGKALTSEEEWADYESRYRSKWVESPVMHREATDRNITPTTQQQVGAGSGTIPVSDEETADLDTTKVAPVHTEATMEVSAVGPSLRWSTFEDTLRQRRQEVLQSSIDNAKTEDMKMEDGRLEEAKRVSGGTLSERERLERRKAS